MLHVKLYASPRIITGRPNKPVLFGLEVAPFSQNYWQLMGRISNAMVFLGRRCVLTTELFKGMAITWESDLNNGAAYTSENTVCSFSSLDSDAHKL